MEEVKRVEFHYGIVMLRTRRFQSIMDRLGRQRISKPIGWALLYIMPVAAGIGLFIFLSQFWVFFSPLRPEIGSTIRNITPLVYLGLPGINPYLPIVDGWIALIIAMVIHEGAHGVIARSLGLPVKSSGLIFFLVVPLGAFVDVDEEAINSAKARDSARVLAAGAGINFLAGIVALLLLFSVVSTMVPAASGLAVAQVAPDSPAQKAGLLPGDYVTAINGIHYTDPTLIPKSGWYKPGQVINMTVWRNGATLQFSNVTLGANPDNNTIAYLGVVELGSTQLQGIVSRYTGSFLKSPAIYLCIPTFPQCQFASPFSGSLAGLYVSPYGDSLVSIATLLYWIFFLNINLAIFNSIPLYPLDGGQAYRLLVQTLGGGKVSEKTLSRITTVTAMLMVAAVVTVPLAAYLHLI